jgi:hypothetical protein
MPRKKREIRSDLRGLGFVESSGKGSYTNFRHPQLHKQNSKSLGRASVFDADISMNSIRCLVRNFYQSA